MRRNGFTLVEMLIALAIFGLIASAGVSLLSVSLATQETSDRLLGEVADLRRASALMVADLGQATPRRWRDGEGRPQPGFVGREEGDGVLLTLVRAGWDNPDGAARSSLQRVGYRLANGRLERLAWRHVDGGGEPVVIPLLDGVTRVRLRYRDERGLWNENWTPTPTAQLPRAVEIVTQDAVHGIVRQVLLVGPAI